MIEFAEILDTIAHAPIEKRSMTNHGVLNEAYAYAKPSSFSRGMRIDLNGLTILLISGTASIDEQGRTVHVGDFRAQQRRTYENISRLLASLRPVSRSQRSPALMVSLEVRRMSSWM